MAGESALPALAGRIFEEFVLPLWIWGASNALPIAFVLAAAFLVVALYVLFFDSRRLK